MDADSAARVWMAFDRVPRIGFVPPEQRPYVGEDHPLPIGYDATNSQPSTVRGMLVVLGVDEGDRVLDVGSGSGWTTALLGVLTGPTGRVIGVELVPELAEWGAANVAPFDMPWVSIRVSGKVLGAPEDGPYDRILVSAEAHSVPQELVDQLADGGRMVIPVKGRMNVVERRGDDIDVRRFGYYNFVPLR